MHGDRVCMITDVFPVCTTECEVQEGIQEMLRDFF